MPLGSEGVDESLDCRGAMIALFVIAMGLLVLSPEMLAFRPILRTLPKKTVMKMSAPNLGDVPSLLLTVGDYAAEIEKATVGEEVYLPIFRAGLLLFLSGVISAFIAAAIVTKSGTWEGLKDEFDEGKRSQYIYSELENIEKKKEADPQPVESKADDANVEGIDL